jgi:hypothetical protein
VPATGPVSAGGDQGRDFETFRTYLSEELPFAVGLVGLASQDVLAFACTLQRDNLRAKFERDIEAICTQGTFTYLHTGAGRLDEGGPGTRKSATEQFFGDAVSARRKRERCQSDRIQRCCGPCRPWRSSSMRRRGS